MRWRAADVSNGVTDDGDRSGDDDRRDTPLARQLIAEIKAGGHIGVDTYMRRCLTDPEYGYYTAHSGIGRDGDFTTSPEISQVFGELIGLWAAVVWQQMGSPARVNLVEFGPGRGVLMDDALRAARVLPGFLDAVQLHLCEINPAFRALQAEKLAGHAAAPAWHDGWPDLDPMPTIVVANEYLDTIAGTQWRRNVDGGWNEVRVGLDTRDQLTFVQQAGSPLATIDKLPAGEPNSIFTDADFTEVARQLASQSARAPLAALLIDYGHMHSTWGDTLQAVRDHKPEHPLTSPGEADLSLAVDFAAFGQACHSEHLEVDAPITQAEFLGRLGIAERASKLMATNPARANDIESGVYRLMAAPGMGTRFHAIGVRSPGLLPLPGFGAKNS